MPYWQEAEPEAWRITNNSRSADNCLRPGRAYPPACKPYGQEAGPEG
jgi:hypothetical protein